MEEGYVTEDGRKIGGVVMEMKNITLLFGGVVAIKDISFDIRQGEIRAIIGPNGAGKSSMLNVISGFYVPQEGQVLYQGKPRPQMRPYEVARQGIARTFQNIALFEGMSVLDNVMTGRLNYMKTGLLSQALWKGKAEKELTEIEARTRLTTEMMPAHIAHVDGEGYYTFTNRRLSSVFPGRPSDILGMHISDALGPSAFARIEPHLMAAYKGGSPVFEFTEEHGSRRIRVAFTPDNSGGVFILSMDVTEETQARVALQQARRREMAAQMTSGLAHDFSNLLTIILGMQGKLAKMDLPPEADELIQGTLSAARRGGRLLNRIGEMTGQRTLRPQATDMHVLLNELKILASPSLPQGIGLSILDNTPDVMLLLDAGKLQDALLNLIFNARDACGTTGQITVSVHAVGETWLEISVSDTGPGFSPEALKQALNPFFTTKGSEGSGLGLPTVYDMAKSTGGDMRIANTVSGASVTLRLPYRLAPDASGGIALLVEDSESLRATFRDMLIDLGYSVIEATSVDEASALTADIPDMALVLSDIRLEGEATGIDLVDRLAGSSLPCILMTSLPPGDAMHREALKRGPVLQKPFTTQQLSALITPETPS